MAIITPFQFFSMEHYFEENLLNFISTPNFIMIELETTKLEGVGGIMSYTPILWCS